MTKNLEYWVEVKKEYQIGCAYFIKEYGIDGFLELTYSCIYNLLKHYTEEDLLTDFPQSEIDFWKLFLNHKTLFGPNFVTGEDRTIASSSLNLTFNETSLLSKLI